MMEVLGEAAACFGAVASAATAGIWVAAAVAALPIKTPRRDMPTSSFRIACAPAIRASARYQKRSPAAAQRTPGQVVHKLLATSNFMISVDPP
jgi:heme A synthase